MNAVDHRKKTALHFAAEKGHVDVAKVLIQNGADVNAVDEEDKWTHFTSQLRWTCRHCESVDSERC